MIKFAPPKNIARLARHGFSPVLGEEIFADDSKITFEALERGLRGRDVRLARIALGLTQVECAERFQVPVGTLRDCEQSRSMAPDFAMAYIKVKAAHPDLVRQAFA